MQLDVEEVVAQYCASRQRLLVLGYNATLTTAVEAPRQPKRHFDQIRVRLDRLPPPPLSADSRHLPRCLPSRRGSMQ